MRDSSRNGKVYGWIHYDKEGCVSMMRRSWALLVIFDSMVEGVAG